MATDMVAVGGATPVAQTLATVGVALARQPQPADRAWGRRHRELWQ